MFLFRMMALLTLAVSSAALAQPARVTRAKNGDTTIVITAGNGKWGPVRDAVEIKRIAAGTKESTFGRVGYATATADGGVVVYDASSLDGPIIRRFDANGKFMHNLGRRGSGPGEYEVRSSNEFALMMAATPDGSIVVREDSRAVMRFGPDGRYSEGFTLFRSGSIANEIVAAHDGTYWVRGGFPMERRGDPPRVGQAPVIHYDRSGKILDSIVHSAGWAGLGRSSPTLGGTWAPIPDGRVAFTRDDKVGVLLSDPKQRTGPIIIEVAAQPVPYLADERKELEGLEDFRQANLEPGTSSPRRVVPPAKPLVYGAFVDVNDRIWVLRPGPGQKVRPRVVASHGSGGPGSVYTLSYEDQLMYVAFQADGTLLGEARFPPRVMPSFSGNIAWAVVYDADDVPNLVKYRLFDSP